MLQVKKIIEKAIIPKKGSLAAAGYDLFSSEDTLIPPKGKALVHTGIAIACPPHTYARIAPRSGLAVKNFIDVGAGVVDEDYRGEVMVLLFNFADVEFKVSYGDRIAQMIIEHVVQTKIVEQEHLDSTSRGSDGFGSTGISQIREKDEPQQQRFQKFLVENQGCVDAWQEITILELYQLQQEGEITQAQKQQLGELTMRGHDKVFQLLQKNSGKPRKQLVQQLLSLTLPEGE